MLSWRAKRQLIAFLIVFIPLAGIIVFFGYRALPAPTCFDNRKNQEEFGVDCGGPCAPCEVKSPKEVSVFWARGVASRSGVYDVAAQIQNNNEVLSSANLEYEFVLSDKFGTIARRSGQTFLLPRQKRYVIEAGIPVERKPTTIEFHIQRIDWQLVSIKNAGVVLEDKQYKTTEDAGRKQSIVEAVIANRSPFYIKKMEVEFVLLDADSNVIGANKVEVDDFPANSKRTVKSLWPTEVNGMPASVDVDPIVNVLIPGVLDVGGN